MKIGVGLFGNNGHQVFEQVKSNPDVVWVAAAAMPTKSLENIKESFPGVRCYATLTEMLQDKDVRFVSLCSPVRQKQVEEAILCMHAGKHVFAEKPCAFTVDELDKLMETARECHVHFHEMVGTGFDEPYRTIREVVRSGILGEVVQVLAQKSYPFFMERPQDENIDGGLLCQAGIHAFRMIEHTAGKKILEVAATETKLGNPVYQGGLHMAASYMMKLEGGAVASVIANYLNQPGFGRWGNEALRIFGTKGFVESVDGGTKTRLVIGEEDLGPLDIKPGARDYFDLVIDSILGISSAPLTMEDELHSTRAVLTAKRSAEQNGVFLPV